MVPSFGVDETLFSEVASGTLEEYGRRQTDRRVTARMLRTIARGQREADMDRCTDGTSLFAGRMNFMDSKFQGKVR